MRVRPAGPEDLAAAAAVHSAAEGADGSEAQPPPGLPVPWLRHVLETGRLAVAESADGHVVGVAGSRPEGALTALTDCFVHPAHQSAGTGRRLLDAVLPPDGARATFASADRRAVSLYARRGLLPRWPAYYLEAARGALRFPGGGHELVEVDLARARHLVQGPAAPAFWSAVGAVAVEVRAGGRAIGQAMLRWTSPEHPRTPQLATIHESAASGGRAPEVVLAVVGHLLAGGAAGVALQVPGPHPALARLLDLGLRITDVDVLCASRGCEVADPERTTFYGEPLPPV